MVYDSGKFDGIDSLSTKKAASLPTTKKLPRWLEGLDDPPDTPVPQKQTSKLQSSTASQFRQAGTAFGRESEKPPQLGSRKGPPAPGEGLRKSKAEQARKNAPPLNRPAPLADTPTKPQRIKPKTPPSSAVTAPSRAQQKKSTPSQEAGSVVNAEEPKTAEHRKRRKRFSTVNDLARRWNISPKTIRNNLSSGRLQLGTKILGRIRFDIREVVAYEKMRGIAKRTL